MNKALVVTILGIFLFLSCKNETKIETDMTVNPLLTEWDTPFGVPPFDKINSEDYLPASREAMRIHNEEIDVIVNNKEEATFENTLEALDNSGILLSRISNAFFAVSSANTDDVLKETRTIISPELTAHFDEIELNTDLFERINTVYEQREGLNLTAEELFLLEETYKRYVRSGVNLEGDNKERLKAINKRLSELSTKFGENLLDETNDFGLHVTDEKDLGSISESLKASAAEEAKKREYDSGWVFTLQRPSINPYLQSSPNRENREKLFQGYALRGDNDNEKDNKEIILEMSSLRLEKANLLGYKSHADYVLSDNMSQTPQAVYDLMDKLWSSALNMAIKDREALANMMKSEGIKGDFRGSDWRYYVEKIRAERYNFNEDETRPYFEFNAVREGVFMLADKLFGLTYKEIKNAPKWHEDQHVFEVL
ncbi:MAG: hypothetical protein DRI70_07645 [Bacteroidetes bacterium]|nr:MAG: hypothetical protein DRI70_07645 [Bacteroidota bacterium]